MIIRPFNFTDKEKLIDIFRLNVPNYFGQNEVRDFELYLDENSATYLTIENDGKIIGGTGYYISTSDKSGRITWIFFHPDAKGQGAGKKAVECCMKILTVDPGIEKLVVTTSQFAYKFFEQFGFKTVKTVADYWAPGLNLYLMEQPIC